ncbi:unnamed protein product [Moneuplotes crassus]|uniref:Uncharacterized protein n=1 Tax=Euplotes crassus TaxID=5936 RepID=A0AAD2D9Q0_EUPCR|nr:unnamed protein product [Moneuplotes crassus]
MKPEKKLYSKNASGELNHSSETRKYHSFLNQKLESNLSTSDDINLLFSMYYDTESKYKPQEASVRMLKTRENSKQNLDKHLGLYVMNSTRSQDTDQIEKDLLPKLGMNPPILRKKSGYISQKYIRKRVQEQSQELLKNPSMLITKCKKNKREKTTNNQKPPPAKNSFKNALIKTEDWSLVKEFTYAPIRPKEILMGRSDSKMMIQDPSLDKDLEIAHINYACTGRGDRRYNLNSVRNINTKLDESSKPKNKMLKDNIFFNLEAVENDFTRKTFSKELQVIKCIDQKLKKKSKIHKWKIDFKDRLNRGSDLNRKRSRYEINNLNKALVNKIKTTKAEKTLKTFNRIHNSVDEGVKLKKSIFEGVCKEYNNSFATNWIEKNRKRFEVKKDNLTTDEKYKAMPKQKVTPP